MSLNLKSYKKIGIMGGTFDPIHNQHLYIANTAFNKLNLDVVIFIPTGQAPHKSNIFVTDKNDRFNMVSMAINDNENFLISDIETSLEKTSYSFETIQKIKDLNENATLYFIVGIDTLYTLHTWRNLSTVANLCKIVTFDRPNYKETKETKEVIEKFNIDVIMIDDIELDLSSTAIRQKLYNKEHVKYLIPDNVIEYINKNNLYEQNYDDDFIEKLTLDLKYNVSEKRYKHTLSVTSYADKLCDIYNENVTHSKVACLLHDFAKEMSLDKKLEYLNENNIYIDEYTKNNIDIAHGLIAKDIAKKVYNINDENILNAIEFHTTGRPNMSTLEKIVFLADKLEYTREYKNVDELRKLSFEDLDKTIVSFLEANSLYLKLKQIEDYPLGTLALDYYRKSLIKE